MGRNARAGNFARWLRVTSPIIWGKVPSFKGLMGAIRAPSKSAETFWERGRPDCKGAPQVRRVAEATGSAVRIPPLQAHRACQTQPTRRDLEVGIQRGVLLGTPRTRIHRPFQRDPPQDGGRSNAQGVGDLPARTRHVGKRAGRCRQGCSATSSTRQMDRVLLRQSHSLHGQSCNGASSWAW